MALEVGGKHSLHVPRRRGDQGRDICCGAYPVSAGETILVHSAAGGVGILLCQWARHLGARVIGTVGSKEKAEFAREHGCDHVILHREEDVVERVRTLTGGEGVPVVFDAVGKDTFETSFPA